MAEARPEFGIYEPNVRLRFNSRAAFCARESQETGQQSPRRAKRDGGFDDFMAQPGKIAAAYSSGDASLVDAIVASERKATVSPTGGSVSGVANVAARYDSDANEFSPGSETKLKVLQASQEIAFWTGFQVFDGKIGEHPTKMKLRITEIFRRDSGKWKLIHRHADPASTLSKPKSLKSAATNQDGPDACSLVSCFSASSIAFSITLSKSIIASR
ncbi:nuclear transport factor 2 family protein [Mesorhizobium sp. B2-1-3A]|uniref:YybH family protein n=1 Tax=Mesorhizobium sp. B2-1-3A TaxID=2589971 RepID=UPI001128CF1D|nr:nuclear transport factor 2 family protein [Mesorhizobium sp. B2-1-3A]TPM94902.1 nuclear transport factor 2 family protein [Mesorhizobium sp. B2-1-3A]